jgi:hypothetical protein
VSPPPVPPEVASAIVNPVAPIDSQSRSRSSAREAARAAPEPVHGSPPSSSASASDLPLSSAQVRCLDQGLDELLVEFSALIADAMRLTGWGSAPDVPPSGA